MIDKLKNVQKNIKTGILHIHCSHNNTIVTVTELDGKTICWSSAGSSGFKGARKETAFAAQIAIEQVISNILKKGLKQLIIQIKGQGFGRESIVRSLRNSNIKILSIKDVTPIAHNGCRPPKRRKI